MSKEFCPASCLNTTKDDRICKPPDPLDHCIHTKDHLTEPFNIEFRQTRKRWVVMQVIGENKDDWITDNGSYIKKSSPLIRNERT